MTTIGSLLVFFGIIGIVSASSKTDITLVTNLVGYILMAIYFPNSFFQVSYVAPKIVSKIKDLSPIAQYNILQIGRKHLWIMTFAVGGLVFLYIFPQLGLKDFLTEAVFDKIFSSFLISSIFLFLLSMPVAMIFSLSTAEEMEMSFDIMQNFDKIIQKYPTQLVSSWKLLIKNILYGSETIVKKHIDISSLNFSEPFNIVCLAILLGNDEQKNNAQLWILQLKEIVLNVESNERKKAESILNHLETVIRKFPKHSRLYKRYNLDCKLEPIRWTRVIQKLGTLGKVVIGITTIAGFILVVVQFILNI